MHHSPQQLVCVLMQNESCDLTEVPRECKLLLPGAVVPGSYGSIITSSKHQIIVKLHHTANTDIFSKN